MDKSFKMLEFEKIIEQLQELAVTDGAKEKFTKLIPYLKEIDLRKHSKDTMEARKILDTAGTPPLAAMKEIEDIVKRAERGEMLMPEDLNEVCQYAAACKRTREFLKRCFESGGASIAAYGMEIQELLFIREEIEQKIRNERVDDYASKELKTARMKIEGLNNQIRQKMETLLRGKKNCFADQYVTNRNGHFTLPVKKEYKSQIPGSVIDTSSSGATVFIEPAAAAKLREELTIWEIQEDNEERKILYQLSALVCEWSEVIMANAKYMEKLDFIFAKGKLSVNMNAITPNINTQRKIIMKEARHPLLNSDCVPLDFELRDIVRGIVITGPNTGGKTVALKTIGLLSIMAQCGLDVPCREADFCMNSQVLCDIGDGQSISENLSTFSSHIKNVIHIVELLNEDSLILLDELGSGTDPAEGMGIAVAILEELCRSHCHFVATTHYPEVKQYAEETEGVLNARMAFDKESLKPLYRMEIGTAGESCAFYIAERLGMPKRMLQYAYKTTYGKGTEIEVGEKVKQNNAVRQKSSIVKIQSPKKEGYHGEDFQIGDSVIVMPERKLGIIFRKADSKGEIGVQIQKKKKIVNYKRLQLKASAKDLYPEGYDFSIIFDTVENRKVRHQMKKHYCPELLIDLSENF